MAQLASKIDRRIETDFQREHLIKFIETLDLGDKGLKVTIQPFAETRTQQQNRFLWAAVYQPIATQMSEKHGRVYTKDHIHWAMQEQYPILVQIPEGMPGAGKMFRKSTTKYTRKEFSDYLEQVWAYWSGEGVFFDSGY